MSNIYKFRVSLCEAENILWRDIEITSVSSVAKLGYAILAAIESTASHLFNISYNGERYEVLFDEEDIDDEIALDATMTKLSSLKFKVGDKLTMEYDYGSSWRFDIVLLSVTEMQRGTGTHYPYITDGNGKGIIEDISPDDFIELIKKTDKDGTLPVIADAYSGEEIEWDYRDFNLEHCNMFFKDIVSDMQIAYEECE